MIYGDADVSAMNQEKELIKVCEDVKKLVQQPELPYSYKKTKKYIKKYCKKWNIDLIHSYSMPDDITLAAIESAQAPVIHDVRDISTTYSKKLYGYGFLGKKRFLNSWFLRKIIGWTAYRFTCSTEKKAMEKSDARIFSTPCMLEYAHKKYNLKGENIVFFNYALGRESSFPPQKKLSFSQGGIHIGFTGNVSVRSEHRNFIPIFKKLANEKIHVHMHVVADKKSLSACKEIAQDNEYLHFYPPMPMLDILKELSKCDYGLLPFPPDIEKKYFDTILPNKLFDYLVVGLPVASSNVKCAKRFLEKRKIGFIYEDVNDLALKLTHYKDKFSVDPSQFIIDNHIQELNRFYEKVAG
jgi:glycosyltransferase involved in cell wall biosynthesis